MLIMQKRQSLIRNLVRGTFGKLLMVFSTKVNLLDLPYLMTLGCRILHLMKQNCLLESLQNPNLDG